jgi:hypothetical protein
VKNLSHPVENGEFPARFSTNPHFRAPDLTIYPYIIKRCAPATLYSKQVPAKAFSDMNVRSDGLMIAGAQAEQLHFKETD